LNSSLIAPQAERLLIRRFWGATKVKANQDVGIENDWDAKLTRRHADRSGSRGGDAQGQLHLLLDYH
jgi:hypothetical protein